MNTKPALKVLLLFGLGLVVGRYCNFPAPLLLLLSIFPIFIAFTIWYHNHGNPHVKELCLAASLVLLGVVRHEIATGYFQRNHILNFTNSVEPVAILGRVVQYPERRGDRVNLTVEAQEILINREVKPTQGKILVSIQDKNCDIEYGDEIIIRGKLRRPRDKRNPGEFDYREYLFAQGIIGIISVHESGQIKKYSSGGGSWLLRNLVYPVKSYLDEFIARNLPTQEAALLRGLLMGERGEISSELRDDFAKLGVIHILAVSGLHVGFIMIIFMSVFGFFRVPYWARVVLTLLGLVFYAFLTNLKPPVVRASIMGGVLLLGTLVERKTDVINNLALAALVILIMNPLELFQSGFQLSFAAVASIIYIYPKLRNYSYSQKFLKKYQGNILVRYPIELLLVSAAAFLGTLPFTVLYFNRLPSISLVANLLVVPLSFCSLASGMVASFLNLIIPVLTNLYLAATYFFLHLLIKIVEWGSRLPLAYLEFYKSSSILVLGYFIALLLIINFSSKKAKRWLFIYALILANFIVWKEAAGNSHDLKVVFFDVGQGDATLLSFPNGKTMLIDGGPRALQYDAGKSVIAQYLKREAIRQIEVLVLSHAETDHLGGFPHILRTFKVREVWDNGQAKNSEIYKEYLSLIDSLDIRRRVLRAGELLEDFNPIKIFVFHPTDDFLRQNPLAINDGSLVLKVSYGEIDFLFVGDAEKNGELDFLNYGDLLASEVLKVGHHGSQTSTSQLLLDQIQPRVAVISVGEFNKFNHPHREVLQRLNSAGAQIFRTDQNAAIILKTNGKEIKRIHWK